MVANSECELLLRSLLDHYDAHHLHENVRFYAERLYYQNPSSQNLYALADSYFKLGKAKQCYLILQNSPHLAHPSNRYLLAQACVSLEKLDEAERALLPSRFWTTGLELRADDMNKVQEVPGGAAGVFLLGTICRKQNRRDAAVHCFRLALQMDPYMWVAVKEISEIGIECNLDEVFSARTAAASSSGLSAAKPFPKNCHALPNNPHTGASLQKSEREQVMHSKFIAENVLSGQGSGTPKASMSIGLSSLSLRMPFSSPGHMPLPAAHKQSFHTAAVGGNNRASTSSFNNDVNCSSDSSSMFHLQGMEAGDYLSSAGAGGEGREGSCSSNYRERAAAGWGQRGEDEMETESFMTTSKSSYSALRGNYDAHSASRGFDRASDEFSRGVRGATNAFGHSGADTTGCNAVGRAGRRKGGGGGGSGNGIHKNLFDMSAAEYERGDNSLGGNQFNRGALFGAPTPASRNTPISIPAPVSSSSSFFSGRGADSDAGSGTGNIRGAGFGYISSAGSIARGRGMEGSGVGGEEARNGFDSVGFDASRNMSRMISSGPFTDMRTGFHHFTAFTSAGRGSGTGGIGEIPGSRLLDIEQSLIPSDSYTSVLYSLELSGLAKHLATHSSALKASAASVAAEVLWSARSIENEAGRGGVLFGLSTAKSMVEDGAVVQNRHLGGATGMTDVRGGVPARRVSFLPNARLSFSGAVPGRGAEPNGKAAAREEEEEEEEEEEGGEEGEEEEEDTSNSIEDEHPFKLQRKSIARGSPVLETSARGLQAAAASTEGNTNHATEEPSSNKISGGGGGGGADGRSVGRRGVNAVERSPSAHGARAYTSASRKGNSYLAGSAPTTTAVTAVSGGVGAGSKIPVPRSPALNFPKMHPTRASTSADVDAALPSSSKDGAVAAGCATTTARRASSVPIGEGGRKSMSPFPIESSPIRYERSTFKTEQKYIPSGRDLLDNSHMALSASVFVQDSPTTGSPMAGSRSLLHPSSTPSSHSQQMGRADQAFAPNSGTTDSPLSATPATATASPSVVLGRGAGSGAGGDVSGMGGQNDRRTSFDRVVSAMSPVRKKENVKPMDAQYSNLLPGSGATGGVSGRGNIDTLLGGADGPMGHAGIGYDDDPSLGDAAEVEWKKFRGENRKGLSDVDPTNRVVMGTKLASFVQKSVLKPGSIPNATPASVSAAVGADGLVVHDLPKRDAGTAKRECAGMDTSIDEERALREQAAKQQQQQQQAAAASLLEAEAAELRARETQLMLGVQELNQLLSSFYGAYNALCAFRCEVCIASLRALPPRHAQSGLVKQLIGKAYYEMNDYQPAVLAFREMLRLEPFRLSGIEHLSTALWHLKMDKELCALAQRAAEIDKFTPETWCVVGNSLSIQKEPDLAIRFFQRALQIEPSFTYAHTLCGHEQINNEDLDKAMDSFRQAILLNERHYNAWYGIGTIYFRQERFELSEYHFRRALSINAASSVLHCYLGMALHAQGSHDKSMEALDVLSVAIAKDSINPQLHFQRAHILVSMDRLEDALTALQIVHSRAPKEPPVHALLGQVLHRLGDTQQALHHFHAAMDLDPKEAGPLKALMEEIDELPLL